MNDWQRELNDCRMVKIPEKRGIFGHSSCYGLIASPLTSPRPKAAGPLTAPRSPLPQGEGTNHNEREDPLRGRGSKEEKAFRREARSSLLCLVPSLMGEGNGERSEGRPLWAGKRSRACEQMCFALNPKMSKNRRLAGQKRAHLCPCCRH